MKITRPALCLALVASVTAVGAAGAATKPKPKPVKPVCNLITDDPGDSEFVPGLPDSSMDIVSADIASNAKALTAVIRVKDLNAASNATYLGRIFYIRFVAPGATNPIFLSATTDVLGDSFSWGALEDAIYSGKGEATGSIDKAKNEIRITASTGDLETLGTVKPGTKFTELFAESDALVGVPGVGGVLQQVDEATGAKPYTAGALSCVKPG